VTRETREVRREISGLQQRWLERPGDGIPVVFVNGIPASPELWRYVTPNVAAGRLLAWEMPGYGRSWDVPSALDISVGHRRVSGERGGRSTPFR
jgi:pimeloyl-ACP methyl ester carboxylesterase